MECIHRHSGTDAVCCRLASTLAQTEAPTSPEACRACILTERPMGLNTVVCSLAYAVNKDPELITLFKQLNKTVYNKPGSALRNILHKLKVFEGKGCQCDEYASLMDSWGTEGCLQRIPEIVAHLNSHATSWYNLIKVALGGYLSTEALVKDAIQCSTVRT